MKLNYSVIGKGQVIFILHGLLGMSDNWATIAKELAKTYTVLNIDLRNHGVSPHSDFMDYHCMSDDLLEIIKDNNFSKVSLVGHSMGGKLAMVFADKYRDIVEKLIVIDICHRSYENTEKFEDLLNAIEDLKLNTFKSREELNTYLSSIFHKSKTAKLLQKNIKRNLDNTFSWKFNHKVIKNKLQTIGGYTKSTSPIYTKTLFIKGELSDYIRQKDENEIKKYFKNVSIQTIQNASHWVHADQPTLLIKSITNFIK